MNHRYGRHRSKAGRKALILRLAFLVCVILLLLIAIWYIGSRIERGTNAQENRGDIAERFVDEEIVEYSDARYSRRKRQTSILFMGIDQRDDQVLSGVGYRNGGQADFLLLLVVDDDEKRVTPIQIDRDTMTAITVLGVLGNPSGTRNAQICLSHGFGDGGAQSCEFTADAVSKLLLGVDIDFYVAMNMDGISVLNDFLGCVTVTLEDDFSALDPEMTEGTTLTLMGDQAEYYVRNRMGIGIGTNEARMARQRSYMATAGELFDAKIRENANYVGDLYDELEPYLITDMKRGRMINVAANCKQYDRVETISLDGTHEVGKDGFMEFHADEAALEALVMDLFYKPVE